MKCPGQDSRYWSGEDVFETECPRCGHVIEFFKDDSQRRCSSCGHRMLNPKMDFGCASYCPYAEQCLGSLPPEMLAQRNDLFKDQLAIAVRKHFSPDEDRYKQASDIASLAETLGKKTEGANMALIMATALLLHTDHHEENIADSAGTILQGLKADAELIDDVCHLITDFHSGTPRTAPSLQILHDADRLVHLKAKYCRQAVSREQLDRDLDSLLTSAAVSEGRRILLPLVNRTEKS